MPGWLLPALQIGGALYGAYKGHKNESKANSARERMMQLAEEDWATRKPMREFLMANVMNLPQQVKLHGGADPSNVFGRGSWMGQLQGQGRMAGPLMQPPAHGQMTRGGYRPGGPPSGRYAQPRGGGAPPWAEEGGVPGYRLQRRGVYEE